VKTVLFLCSANYYRSRFSEIFFNHLAERERLPWRADSRGLRADMVQGLGPISHCTLEGLDSLDIPLQRPIRYPMQATEADLARADLVVAVKEAEHRQMMAEQFPAWADRIEYWHIDDLDFAEPEEALPQLCAQIERLVKRLRSEEGDRPLLAAG
jgi:protein-tyrosine phosphatase